MWNDFRHVKCWCDATFAAPMCFAVPSRSLKRLCQKRETHLVRTSLRQIRWKICPLLFSKVCCTVVQCQLLLEEMKLCFQSLQQGIMESVLLSPISELLPNSCLLTSASGSFLISESSYNFESALFPAWLSLLGIVATPAVCVQFASARTPLLHLRAASMKSKSLQNSVSKRGTVVESFFCQLSSQLGSHFWSLGLSIGARKTISKGSLGL